VAHDPFARDPDVEQADQDEHQGQDQDHFQEEHAEVPADLHAAGKARDP